MRCKKLLCGALSASLVVAFAPHAAFAQDASENGIAEQEAAQLDQTLAGNDYVQGQAIVVVDTSVSDAIAGAAHSMAVGEDLLAGAEDIMDASGSSFTEATGQQQNTDVQVKCVSSDTLSTKELIAKLLEDPRVISAEPNVQVDAAVVDGEQGGAGEGNVVDDADAGSDIMTASIDCKASTAVTTAKTSATTATKAVAATAASSDSSASAVAPKAADKAINITGTDSMLDLSDYQWYTGADSGALLQPGATTASSLEVPGWNSETNANGAVVAVMDSGINYNHPDIQPNMMDMTQYNKGTEYENVAGKYGYYAAGWDQESTSDPMDEEGHGTHVAGIMCSNWDNKGTSGIAGGAKLVAVRITDNNSFSYLACLKGYQYLSKMMDQGLNLTSINCSWAGNNVSPALCVAMTELGQKGAVSCIASGNEGKDISVAPYSTAAFATSPYAVVVNSSNIRGEKSDFSNYGQGVTDVYAPGSSILSTYLASYLSFADPSPAYYQNFADESAASKVIVRKCSHDAVPFGDGEVVGTYSADASFDKGTGSLAIPLDTSQDTQEFELLIPATQEELASATHLGFTVCGNTEFLNLDYNIAVATKKGETSYSATSGGGYVNTWFNTAISLSDSVDNSDKGAGIAFKDGYISVKLTVSADDAETVAAGDGMLYLDTIGLGSNVCDYGVMHGTSMATPCVTASAAVIATQLEAQGLKGEQLGQALARAIKSSVVQSDALRANSTAGGYFSFGMLSTTTPVIEGYEQDGESLTLTGAGFGAEQGAVTLGDTSVSIASWADDKITLSIPSTLSSGSYAVMVKAADGRTGSAKLELSIDKPTLYEKSVTMPAGSGGPAESTCSYMAAYKGKVYVLCGMPYGNACKYKQLWSYQVSNGKWSKLASLPYSNAVKASMTVYKGKLLVSAGGLLVRSSMTKKNALYSYDFSTNKWTKIAMGKKLPYATALSRLNGKLLCIGGMEQSEYGTLETTKKIYHINLKKKTLTKVGKITVDGDTLQASSSDGTLYVNNASVPEITSATIEQPLLNAFRFKKGKLVRYNMKSALPKAADGYMNSYGAVATPSGLVISGYPAKADDGSKSVYDSYRFTVSKKGVVKCKKLVKSFSYDTALQLTSCYSKGYVFTMGTVYNESNPQTMRATKL